jgi:hypothetical protein
LFEGVESAETTFARSGWRTPPPSEIDQIDQVDQEGLPEPEGRAGVRSRRGVHRRRLRLRWSSEKEAATREAPDAESGDEGWDSEFDEASEQAPVRVGGHSRGAGPSAE